MSEAEKMTKEKCVLKLAMASRLCDNLMSKELLVLSCLIHEPRLRVSDIHTVLGGNKSWVSNLCSRIGIAGLASFSKEGREVYYSLTQKGIAVANHAYELIYSLLEAEKTLEEKVVLSDNTFVLYKIPEFEVKEGLKNIISPIHTHKGAILYNKDEKYICFIGKNSDNKLLNLEIPLENVKDVVLSFDDYYRRRKRPRPTPLRITFEDVTTKNLQIIYIFTNFHTIGRKTQNPEWLELFTKQLNLVQAEKGKTLALESEKDVAPMVGDR